VRKYGGYAGRNPKTAVKIDVKPKSLPFFMVGKELKERVNRV
jgi:integration host factor subunit beta